MEQTIPREDFTVQEGLRMRSTQTRISPLGLGYCHPRANLNTHMVSCEAVPTKRGGLAHV